MALLNAGWFQTTWFPSGWWQEDWWQDYGLVAVDPKGAAKAVQSAYTPVAVHQSGVQAKAVHATGTIPKGVKG
ncbi:MAG: hypothetical protein HY887_07165 [Deltaproteobacteria bacterium]|nr:hypothetical protein [Deltaproteobacteria bacterium]